MIVLLLPVSFFFPFFFPARVIMTRATFSA